MGENDRFSLTLIDTLMKAAVCEINFERCDLILIDDSLSVEERVETIREVAEKCYDSNVVVIHDYENGTM